MKTSSLALRFLGSKKSHGAVNAVAIVSIVGVAVATAAIVSVLSVFNGFRDVLGSKLDTLTPDITVEPLKGKTIPDGDSLASALREIEGVAEAVPMVEDQALALWNSNEMPVSLRGVDSESYRRITQLDSLIIAKEGPEHRLLAEEGLLPTTEAIASIGMAAGIGTAYPGSSLMIFAPRRIGRVNMANPMSSFIVDSVRLTSVYESKRTEFDRDILIVPLSTARDLFQYDTEATSVIVKAETPGEAAALKSRIEEATSGKFRVLDRFESSQESFRMVNVEKWVTFLLLFFILLIAGFNSISTLCMLILEKRPQIRTLHALGLSRRAVGRIFAWESIYVAGIGGGAGLLLGVVLCLLQQHYGFIRLSGDPTNLILPAYPVKIEWIDLPLALLPVIVTGLITALSAAGYSRKQIP